MDSYPSLQQRLASVLADESTADVTFLVGEDKVPIRAHSQIVSSASDAFKKMLYGDFNGERTIEVSDGTPEGFKALLR
ncbi:BTB/POZ domain-containing protein 3 [Aphelenchoides avenae]|nr:BTB/POZ domain-containing protein 3 [Aphelenchus avenae]